MLNLLCGVCNKTLFLLYPCYPVFVIVGAASGFAHSARKTCIFFILVGTSPEHSQFETYLLLPT